jgi:5-methylcytosine-specific restriction endonuclease McrA
MAPDDGKRSLQDVLRARREAPVLVTPGEAARRDAARRREGVAAAAVEALERFRDGRSPDGSGKLEPEVYAQLFELSSAAYYASVHWARRARAQLAAAPACEVALCGATAATAARHLNHTALGAEQPGRDLITLCPACGRRAEKLGRRLGRVPAREELVALDPRAPLYDPDEIAALRARYAGGR